jgi:hypothetical protein
LAAAEGEDEAEWGMTINSISNNEKKFFFMEVLFSWSVRQEVGSQVSVK